MALIKAEITGEYPGLGQMLADKIITEMNVLMEDNIVFRQDPCLLELRSELYVHSHKSETTIEEVKAFYEDKVYPRLLEVRAEIGDGRIVALSEQSQFYRPPIVKTFEEIQALLIENLEEEVPQDAEDSAVDSIIMGDIRLNNLFLPFQAQIKARVLEVLDNAVDIDEDAREKIEAKGKSIIIETYGEDIFEVLALSSKDIEELVESGQLDKSIGDAIASTRSDVENLFGESELDQTRRIQAIQTAHLGIIDDTGDNFTGKTDSVGVADVRVMQLMAERYRALPDGANLRAKEEAIVRMCYGIGVNDDYLLNSRADGLDPEAAAKIALIEAEAFRMLKGEIPPKKPKAPKPKKGLRLVRDED